MSGLLLILAAVVVVLAIIAGVIVSCMVGKRSYNPYSKDERAQWRRMNRRP